MTACETCDARDCADCNVALLEELEARRRQVMTFYGFDAGSSHTAEILRVYGGYVILSRVPHGGTSKSGFRRCQ